MYGWSGTILRVDLNTESISKEPLDQEIAEKFLGGRGLNSRTLYEEVEPGIDPLGPENVLCLGLGPFNGTFLSQTSRMEVSTLSPLSGILGDGNSGGDFPTALKLAGYDQIVVTGKAESPKYLLIEDDTVELRDADDLWGMTTWETTDTLQETHGSSFKVAGIGPAGENLVRFATTISDKTHSAARGSGAVWGSKNLKAVAVKGTGDVVMADPETFKQLAFEDREFFLKDEFQQEVVGEIGTHMGLPDWNPSYRWEEKKLEPDELPEEITHQGLKKYEVSRTACHGCVVGCKDVYEIPSGEYEGEQGSGMEYEHLHRLGINCGILDPEPIMVMQNLCDKHGMCSTGLGNAMGFVKALYNHGIIDEEDTDGLSLEWENVEAQIELVKQTAWREGFGNVVAEGLYSIGEILGEPAKEYRYHIKGLSKELYSPGTYALSHATSTRGKDSDRGLGWTHGSYYPEEFEELQDEGLIPTDDEELVKFGQTIALIPDMTGRCKSSVHDNRMPAPLIYDYPVLTGTANLLTALTGVEYDEEKLIAVTDRVYNLERAFNVRQGVTRDDDGLPQKPSTKNSPEGKAERKEHEDMLTEFFKVRGWDPETGIPTRDTLETYDLGFVADELEEYGPFPEWNGPPLRDLDEYPTGVRA